MISTNQNVLYRLILAKSLLRRALASCETNHDIYEFSQGIIGLHDALDNFLGALCSQLNVSFQKKDIYLLDMLNQLEKHAEHDSPGFALWAKSEIRQINTLRNSIKHDGLMPNISQSKAIIPPIKDFFERYSKYFLQANWHEISMADLIRSEEHKKAIKHIEELILQENYKESLDQMAIIKFRVFDEDTLRFSVHPLYTLGPGESEKREKEYGKQQNIFLIDVENKGIWGSLFNDYNRRFKFVEKGIDKDLVRGFENFTARVGINNIRDWQYVLKHDATYWGEINWTKENAVFCLEFLTDAIIKDQRNSYLHTPAKPLHHDYQIKIVGGSVDVFQSKTNERVYTLREEQVYDVWLMDEYVDGKWENFSQENILILVRAPEKGVDRIVGYLKDTDKYRIEVVGDEMSSFSFSSPKSQPKGL
jgi:hypothetical protein